jgi:hypothetical protein
MTPTPKNCPECGTFLPAAPSNRRGGRKRQFCSDACSKRARRRAVAEPEPAAPASSSHLTECEGVIDAVRTILGSDYTAQDRAEAGALRSLASAVDSDPANVSGLRELRTSLAGYRRLAFRPVLGEQEELARLISSISFNHATRPSLFADVYAAATAAGASPEAAQAAATEAASAPPASWKAE